MAATAGVRARVGRAVAFGTIVERVLRFAAEPRLGVVGLLLVGVANLAAALVPDARPWLGTPAYAAVLAAVALAAVAAAAVRLPVTWREWRRPRRVPPRTSASVVVPSARSIGGTELTSMLGSLGYRTQLERRRTGWAVHGVRRGWAPFSSQLSHLGVVLVVLGAATGSAFGSETTLSLLPGSQALLDAPRAGFASAVRLESLDAAFGPDGRPERLDVAVTFVRDGQPVETATLRVNEPGAFDGYAVHPWTYGPVARLRVTTLGGAALVDDAVPLDDTVDGRPAGSVDLTGVGTTLGLALLDGERGELAVSAVAHEGRADVAVLRPGDEARVGDVNVSLERFDAWVTFLARRDPGAPILLAGATLLSIGVTVGLWLPRRRVTVSPAPGGHRILLRGERFDRVDGELGRLKDALAAAG